MQGAPVIVVNANTKREQGRKAQLGNIQAAKAVSDIVLTTLGPRSMLKMLLDPMGGIVMTNDGNAILREIDVQHPAAKSMIELARAQDEEVGDGIIKAKKINLIQKILFRFFSLNFFIIELNAIIQSFVSQSFVIREQNNLSMLAQQSSAMNVACKSSRYCEQGYQEQKRSYANLYQQLIIHCKPNNQKFQNLFMFRIYYCQP